MENFGERLRRLRGDRSQKAVADELRMPQTTLSSLENQPSVPRGDLLQKLAAHFKVPLTYFYESRESGPKTTDAARAHLSSLLKPMKGRNTVATQASQPVEKVIRERIAAKIEEQLGEFKRKR